ncbi:MAG: response regulator transcription factor [Rhodocyclales bacterium]|nr:response regulator transcription factor [Rhodocyclales bacterium]
MNILLIDDHALFREGFKLMLARVLPDVACVVETGSAEAGLAAAVDEDFDLIFLDLGLPGLGGLDGLRALRRQCPDACLVVLSAVDGSEVVRQALFYGAQGYIPKTTAVEEMRLALRQILDGQVYSPTNGIEEANGAERLDQKLTRRQVEVLAELCAGRSNREIGDYLGMSENTVRVHVSAIFRELGVRSRTEAVLLAKRKGLF